MWTVNCIEQKRDGRELTPEEIKRFINGYLTGAVADYQMAAWLMAVYFQGMTPKETVALTLCMAYSGKVVDLSAIPGIKVDKHSTGGIADTTTLIVAPLVAAAGVPVAKMSGRGLGFTGGTIDKLESIPGFQVELSEEEFIQAVRQHGMAIVGQSAEVAVADKYLYALRDTIATVESIPLIASSIMSKKIAAGADKIVLDVKFGEGAFMKTLDRARELAQTMVEIGRLVHKETVAVLSDMNAPLGLAIGNSLEVDEAVAVLQGQGSRRLKEVVLTIGANMLLLGGLCTDIAVGRQLLQQLIDNGSGLAKFKEFVSSQQGDTAWIGKHPLTKAVQSHTVYSPASGYIGRYDGRALGRLAMQLGAGRMKKDDTIDLHVGIQLYHELGGYLKAGEPLATIYGTATADMAAAEKELLRRVDISPNPPPLTPIIAEIIR